MKNLAAEMGPSGKRPRSRSSSSDRPVKRRKINYGEGELPAVPEGKQMPTPEAVYVPVGPPATVRRVGTKIEFSNIHWRDYEVVLLLDNREVKSRRNRDGILKDLRRKKVLCEQRQLALGDVMWILRRRDLSEPELVLDLILERKKLSDLVMSIKDGRYDEHKFRLKKVTEMRRIIYLIEGDISEKYWRWKAIPHSTVVHAMAHTQVEGITVKKTKSIVESVTYLKILTHSLDFNTRKKNCVVGEDYNAFCARCRKIQTSTPQLLFGSQLRMIKGVSSFRAYAIVEKYPTVPRLLYAYDVSPKPESLLADVKCETGRIGPKLSKRIYNFFHAEDYSTVDF